MTALLGSIYATSLRRGRKVIEDERDETQADRRPRNLLTRMSIPVELARRGDRRPNRSPTERNGEMRVMVLIKANEESERGEMPSERLLTEMTAFNEELVKAGVMLAGEGLHPSAKGVRVAFTGDERKVIDGPFAETKELLAGYWVWQVKSLDEAIEWVKRIPSGDDDTEAIVEIRPVFEVEDFGDELTPELREREAAMRSRVEGA
jgi:hypothetical protein